MPIEIVTGAAATANVAAEPCNLMIYGPPGAGKTTDAVQAFTRDGRCSAFFIPCEDGALKPILARGMVVPDHVKAPVTTWDGMVEAINHAATAKKYNAVIVDTLSTWTANVYPQLEKALGSRNKWDIPVAMRNLLAQLRDGCRALGLHVIYIAHEMKPFVDERGNAVFGGPQLTPKTAGQLFYGRIDSMLRIGNVQVGSTVKRVYYTGGITWPSNYGIPPGDMFAYFTKNREGVGESVVDADLGAFLRRRQPPYAGL